VRFALSESERIEATPKAKGACPGCKTGLIPKCGQYKVWHWAHKGKRSCDVWWEPETKWHRTWKSCFPITWQEVFHTDPATGEKHIADVQTPFGLVVEFQHSPIKPEERSAREDFYKRMLWVVDGNRAETDKYYFESGLEELDKEKGTFLVRWSGISKLFHNWSESKARVFFDFGDPALWRLLDFDKQTKVGKVKVVLKLELQNYINRKVDKFLRNSEQKV